ncbi:MAG: hypothetical protein JWN70_3403 [Planctomycetaceae bacterium]|nr:hypothetical protein [Planctomycetaceae bacterium]
MVWSTINIWSQCFVNCLAIGVLTSCAMGCDSGTPQATAPKPETPAAAATPATPAKADAAKGKPKAEVLGGDTFDFGSTEVGQQFEHVFEIKNVGTADLTLEKGPPSCSTCTSFEVDKLLLKPNEIAKATVKWHVKSENLEFRQYAPVKTNDPDQAEVKMHVKGKIVKRIVLEPVGQWSFGDLAEGQSKEFVGTLTSAVSDKFELESVTSTSPKLKFTSTPMSAEKLAELKVKKGYNIKAELSADVPVGQFSDTVTVKVLTPEPISLKVDAVAKRSGPLQIFGPGWHEERMQLALSAFDPKEPLVSRLFMYTRGVPDELKIVKVDCPDNRFTFELKPDTKFKGQAGDHRRYELFVKVAPSNREAVYTALKPLRVEIETNQDKVKQIKLKITCQAIP